jgi:hypothetical protein
MCFIQSTQAHPKRRGDHNLLCWLVLIFSLIAIPNIRFPLSVTSFMDIQRWIDEEAAGSSFRSFVTLRRFF